MNRKLLKLPNGQVPPRPRRRPPVRCVSWPARTVLSSLVAKWATTYGLSVAERDILFEAVTGGDRGRIAKTRGVEESTVKKQIQQILRKTGAKSLPDVANVLLLRALSETAKALHA